MSAAIPFFAVRYALRGRTLGVLARRFVLGKDETTTLRAMHKPVWIHAVSVGEVNLIAPLLREVKSLTGKDAVVSVINPHAFEIAWRRYGEMARVIYLPVDVSVILRRFIDVIDPSAFIAAETEIWPNLFWHLHRRGVPISIVNGRISDKSLPRYVKSRWFFSSVFRCVSLIAVQNETARERYIAIGADPQTVVVTGNLKYANLSVASDAEKKADSLRPWIADRAVVVAGSTHDPEETTVAEAFVRLRAVTPRVRLIICPRHAERAGKIIELLRAKGISVALFSVFDAHCDAEALVIDRMGYLAGLYALASVVFVGGSLIPHGGQNILEPAYFAKPICVGSHMHNFKDIMDDFTRNRAVVVVNDADGLYNAFLNFLNNISEANQYGKAAYALTASGDAVLSATVAALGKVMNR
jgi:3-deoxy-D-manno-octulosonic-acid transferase